MEAPFQLEELCYDTSQLCSRLLRASPCCFTRFKQQNLDRLESTIVDLGPAIMAISSKPPLIVLVYRGGTSKAVKASWRSRAKEGVMKR
jgi:hypothetical protein